MSNPGQIDEHSWTDRFGDHWEISIRDRHGTLHTRKLTKSPHLGWPDRDAARTEIHQSVFLANSTGHSNDR